MHLEIRRALNPRLVILAALLLALAGVMSVGTAGAASADSSCTAGTHFNGSNCVPADPGYYVAAAGATSETPCPDGSPFTVSGTRRAVQSASPCARTRS